MSPKMPLIVLSAAALALLTGCSSDDKKSAATPPPPPPSLTATPSTGPNPQIKPQDQTDYVKALGQIDKKLAADGGMGLVKGVETCTDIQQGASGQALLDKVKKRYAITDDTKAKRIVAATNTYICPGLVKPTP